MNTNHDPHTGEFANGPGGAAPAAAMATFHRLKQAKHLKAVSAAKRAWVTIRANRAKAKDLAGQIAAKAADAKKAAPALKAAALKSAAGHLAEADARAASARGHKAKADEIMARFRSERAKGDKAADAAVAAHGAARAAQEKAAQASAEGKTAAPAPAANASDAAREERLKSPIVKVERLGGGVSDSKKVTLANGDLAVWKPASGERRTEFRRGITPGQASEREAGNWEVAKLVGMQDLAAPTIIRNGPISTQAHLTIEETGKGQEKGAMIEWAKGDLAVNVSEAEKYDGAKDMARSAVFDMVIGNVDRHDKNWIVERNIPVDRREAGQGATKLHLIDHGLAFPTQTKLAGGNQMMLEKAQGTLSGKPSDYAGPYVKAKGQITTALTKIGLPKDAVRAVGDRIDLLAKSTDWKTFGKTPSELERRRIRGW